MPISQVFAIRYMGRFFHPFPFDYYHFHDNQYKRKFSGYIAE
ncbi:hypothetical protein ABEP00_05385 [Heyndrickxia sporothermodurans]